MKSSAKRAISLLVSAFLLVGALIVYAAWVRPAYDTVTALRGSLIAQQNFFDEKKKAVDKVGTLIMQYKGAGSLEDMISLSLPQSEEVSSVFNQLQAIAGTNGMTVEVFNVQPLSMRSGSDEIAAAKGKSKDAIPLVRSVGTLRLSLRLTGPYAAFKEFVRGLETNIRVMDVVSMKVEPVGAKGADMFAYTLVADTYYQGN